HALRDDRAELVINEVDRADVWTEKFLDRRLRNRLRVRPLDVLEQPGFLVEDVESAAHEEVAALAADQRHRHVTALWIFRLIERELQRGLRDVGVEAAGESAVGGDH